MIRLLRAFILVATVGAASAAAQAYNYPAFQTPRIVDREYNFAAASGNGSGTALLFQWREGFRPDWQFGFDGGLATPSHLDTRVLVGGALAYQVMRETADFPLDIALTAGVGLSGGDGVTVVRIPVGASVGHTFELDNGMALTPFAHPRLSVDDCSSCGVDTGVGRPGSDSRVNVDVDVGVDFRVTPQISLRLAALLGAADFNGGTNSVGFSLAWTPKGLKK
jgi:hypothetical protein